MNDLQKNVCAHESELLFSVIIPAYNAERYIESCINSVCLQNIPTSLFEVIVVDDGSSDHTAAIVRKLQDKYSNLKLVCQANGRQGKARNTGVENSEGQYILFLDSDDLWIYSDVLFRLKHVVTKYSPDYVFTKGFHSISNDEQLELNRYNREVKMEMLNADSCIASHDFSFSACNYIYKRDLYDEKKLKFAEGCFFEDLDFCVRALYAKGANAIVIKMLFPYYGYRENPESTTRNPSIRMWIDNLTALERLLVYVAQKPGDSMRSCFVRFYSELKWKLFKIFREKLVYSECVEIYTQWLSAVRSVEKSVQIKRPAILLPLVCYFYYGKFYRLMRRFKQVVSL